MDFLRRSSSRKRGSNRSRTRAALIERLEQRSLLSLTPIPASLNLVAGEQPSPPVTIGSFLDSDLNAVSGNFTAAIAWGDGHTSAGTVSATSTPGRFDVTGTNLYLTPNTYAITIQIDDYQGDSTAINSTAYVAAPVLTPVGTVLNFTAGVPTSGPVTVGSFFDTNPSPAASSFTATITWGDGNTSAGTVTASTTKAGLFLVSGTNLYTTANTYTISVLVQDQTGHSTTITSKASVTSNTVYSFTGGLADVITNGPHAAMGFTNTNRPTFTGTAAPYAIVQLYARHFNTDAKLPLGEAVANGNGQWSLTTGPLAVGTYIVSATVTLPGGYPSGTITLHKPSGTDLVHIDLTPRLVRWLSHGQKSAPHPKMSKPPRVRHHKA